MPGSEAASDGTRRRSAATRGAAALVVVAALAWFLLVATSGFGCALGCSDCGGTLLPALVPCLVLCALGVALWRRTAWCAILAPIPLVLSVVLIAGAAVLPATLGVAACAIALRGIGLDAPWMSPQLVPWSTGGEFILVVVTLVVPTFALVMMSRAEPAAWARARRMGLSARAVRNAAWLTLAAAGLALVSALLVLVVQRFRPLGFDEELESFSRGGGQVRVPDPLGRLQILNVKFSRIGATGFQRAGAVLDARLGPVEWSTHQADPDRRYVIAAGHFPQRLWRPRFDARVLEFDRCLDALRSNGGSIGYIEDWSAWWRGRMTTDEVNRKWQPTLFGRDWMSGGMELYLGLANCAQVTPRVSPDEFSRVVLQWHCSGLRCGWAFIDPDAWERVTPGGCRERGSRRCVEEMLNYLTGGGSTRQ